MTLAVENKMLAWLFGSLAVVIAATAVSCGKAKDEDTRHVYALMYGYSEGFSRSVLVKGAPDGDTSPMAWMAWLIRGKGKTILVDTGFSSEKVAKKWKIQRFSPVDKLLSKLDVSPQEVTDVVITHLHWDHAGNLKPYGKAMYWVQKGEADWARGKVSEDRPSRAGVRLKDLKVLDALAKEGRVTFLDGDMQIAPGIFLRKGGTHTGGTQWVEVKKEGSLGTIVLASDNAYLYENLEKMIPIGSCLSHDKNRKNLERMLRTASHPRLVVPGHDPLIMKRHKTVVQEIVEIE